VLYDTHAHTHTHTRFHGYIKGVLRLYKSSFETHTSGHTHKQIHRCAMHWDPRRVKNALATMASTA